MKAKETKAKRHRTTEKGKSISGIPNRTKNKLQLNISKKNQQRVKSIIDRYGINKYGEERKWV